MRSAAEGRPLRLSSRTIDEVFRDHLELRAIGDVERDIERNFAPEVVLLSSYGVFRGHAGVRQSADLLAEHLGEARFGYTRRLVEKDVAFLEWEAWSQEVSVCDGADTFVIRNGLIAIQTIHYTVRHRAATSAQLLGERIASADATAPRVRGATGLSTR